MNGGADENTVISCNQAVRSGHYVILVHGAQTRPEILATVDARVEILELPSLVHPIAPLSDMKALRDLVRTFRRLGTHVVHTHTSKAGILGRLAARAASVPVVVTRRAHRALRQRRPTRDVRVPDGGEGGPGDDARLHRRQSRHARSVRQGRRRCT